MTLRRPILAAVLLLLIAGLVALGVWQLQRRTAKLALIVQVEHGLAAAPVAAPAPGRRVRRADAYMRVTARGRWRPVKPALTQATTELGGGFWVVAPLDTDRGTILVNRGFVPPEQRSALPLPTGAATVTGLLRVTEPGGGFLRSNVPAEDRWYSRDVKAIAAARGWGPVAGYFIDADRAPGERWPRGGLTVVRFANNHLVYAFTWFAMAGMLAGAAWWVAGPRARA